MMKTVFTWIIACLLLLVSIKAEVIELHTSSMQYRNFYPIEMGSTMQFKVKTKHDAFILFTTKPSFDERDPFIEINIGGRFDTESFIRKSRSEEKKVVVQREHLLQKTNRFWVKLIGAGIMVGEEGQVVPLLSWVDPSPVKIAYFSVTSGLNATGDWSITVKEQKVDTVCSPGSIKAGSSPWNEGQSWRLVEESCYQLLMSADDCPNTEQALLPLTLNPSNNKRFVITEDLKSWNDAKAACEGQGHQLASVRNKREQELLEQAILNLTNPFSGVWIAASDRDNFGMFKWYDGTLDPVTFTNWEDNRKPNRNTGSGSHCVVASYISSLLVRNQAYWDILGCSEPWNYVCQTY